MKVTTLNYFVLALLCSLTFTQDSCVNHDFPQYTCDSDPLTFDADVLQVVEAKCAIPGCHNGDLGPDFVWTEYPDLAARAENGELKRRVLNRIMPPSYSPNGPLNQEQINILVCWVDKGYPEN